MAKNKAVLTLNDSQLADDFCKEYLNLKLQRDAMNSAITNLEEQYRNQGLDVNSCKKAISAARCLHTAPSGPDKTGDLTDSILRDHTSLL
jgi:hypothetical protein